MTFIYLILAGFGILLVFLFKLWQKIDRGKEENQTTLLFNQRFDSLTKTILDELKESRQSVAKTSMIMHEQVQSFTKGITKLEEGVKGVHESLRDVVSFQDIFKSPKLRGQWGETSLESVLAGYFPKELYAIQHYFKSGEAVDAVFRLPNDYLLPIDSKFNWENFEKMVQSEDDISRDNFRKQFISDVKKKIDEISSKYILPSEGTTDFAFMYVPAETIFYEMVQNIKEPDIAEYARRKRIILVSPNTFFLSLSAVHHWYRDFNITKQTRDIIGRLSRVKIDAGKLNDSFRKLGKHLSDASSAYGDSEKRLTLLTDRVERVVEVGEIDKEEKSEAVNEIEEKVEV